RPTRSLRSWRFDRPETLGERPFRVDPLLDAGKPRLARQVAYPGESEFMARFRPDSLACLHRELEIRRRDAHPLSDFRAQVHLDPFLGLVVAGLVPEVPQVEIATQFA